MLTPKLLSRLTARIDKLAKRIAFIEENFVRAETTNGVLRVTTGDLPSNRIAGRLRYVTDNGALWLDNGNNWTPVQAPIQVTVAGLAELSGASEGFTAYATDGRKLGEASGSGTGVPVYYSGGVWYRYSDDTQVSA